MLTPNISETNAFLRMMGGVAMTAFGIGKVVRKPTCTTGRMLILMGAMRVAEGYYQYCPITAMVQKQSSQSQSPYSS